MSTSFEIHAEARRDVGKGASRRLRRAKKFPAIIYGAGKPPQSLALDQEVMLRRLSEESFYSHVLTVHIDGQPEQAVLKDVQRHPHRRQILHIDLLRTSATQKLHMQVPLHFVGEDKSPGVKQGGLVTHQLNEVEIECLPKDLPEYLEVDLAGVDLDGLVHLSDLPLPPGVTIPALAHGEDQNQVVASIHLVHVAAEEGEEGEEAEEREEREEREAGEEPHGETGDEGGTEE